MHSRRRFIVATTLAGVVLLAGSSRMAGAGVQTSTATCTGAPQITFSWDWYEFDFYTTAHPEWVGYDVLRRPLNTCTPFERINAQSLPRVFGQAHSNVFVDTPPSQSETYEYRAVPVDVNRDPVVMLYPDCDPPCVKPTWASCPPASAPLVVGEITDWGWALAIGPCPGSCFFGFYFDGPIAQELRDQGRVGTIVKLFGTGWCCGVEGAAMNAVAWEPGNCVSTPARRTSWGELKTIYR